MATSLKRKLSEIDDMVTGKKEINTSQKTSKTGVSAFEIEHKSTTDDHASIARKQ
jgi:hypothetical protein